MLIAVYILSNNACSSRIKHLKKLFYSSLFEVNIFDSLPPAGLNVNNTNNEQMIEAYQVHWILEDASKRYPDNSVIIIKETSVSVSDSQTIARIIRNANTKKGWDLCYLCKWLDRCDLYRDMENVHKTTASIARTFSPFGIQALMFSPHGRDIVLGKLPMNNGKIININDPLGVVLNKEINDNNINATTVVPNLFEYDVSLARTTGDLAKLSECRIPPDTTKSQGALPFFWFLLIVIIILILAWAIYEVGPQDYNVGLEEQKWK
jgi:hypothetical protein